MNLTPEQEEALSEIAKVTVKYYERLNCKRSEIFQEGFNLPKENQMQKYKTKPIDYTGCNSIIAEHLKRGEQVECEVSGIKTTEQYVSSYHLSSKDIPVYGTEKSESYYTKAEPIAYTQYVKKASTIVEWLEDNGYTVDKQGNWNSEDNIDFAYNMFVHCGRADYDDDFEWLDEWLEWK
jgi:hypothetical protein